MATEREAFVHAAHIVLDPGADQAAPGGAVTLALCGAWEHAAPCTWPHHTEASPSAECSGELELRTVFIAGSDEDVVVRHRIDAALTSGEACGPDGSISRWTMRWTGPAALEPNEAALAARLQYR